MSWKDRRVLVTGAGGFIGSHLAERLAAEGARVRALVHYNALDSRGWLSGHDAGMDVVAGDITDAQSVREAMRDCEVVFHLAALIAIPYSYRAPASYLAVNAGGTLNVLQAARDLGPARIVHTSTSEVYGTARRIPIDETHPLQAQSPYAASKIAADKLVESFHLSFASPVVTVRPFNTFGPRQSARAVIPAIVVQLLDGGVARLGNLEPVRDLSFITNTVEGFLAAGAAEGVAGETFNLGTGRAISIGQLAELIAQLMGIQPRIETDTERVRPSASEVDRLVCDAGRAKQRLGWEPRVSLGEGLIQTIDWLREHRDRYRGHDFVV